MSLVNIDIMKTNMEIVNVNEFYIGALEVQHLCWRITVAESLISTTLQNP